MMWPSNKHYDCCCCCCINITTTGIESSGDRNHQDHQQQDTTVQFVDLVTTKAMMSKANSSSKSFKSSPNMKIMGRGTRRFPSSRPTTLRDHRRLARKSSTTPASASAPATALLSSIVKPLLIISSCLLIFAPLNTSAFRTFDDSSLFTIDWRSDSEAPEQLLNSYIKDTLSPENALIITSDNNEKFVCNLPVDPGDKEKVSVNYMGKTPRELLQKLYSQRQCTYRIETYWTYELCHGRYLLQYHETKDSARRTTRQEYYLGQYVADVVAVDEKEFDHMNPPKRRIEEQMLAYYPVRYVQGTVCDITGQPRVTTVNYVCFPGGKNQVYSFDEISSCEYELVVLTTKICTHPAFKIDKTPVNKVECYPVDGAPKKPTALTIFEREKRWENQRTDYKDMVMGSGGKSEVADEKPPLQPSATRRAAGATRVEDDDEDEDEDDADESSFRSSSSLPTSSSSSSSKQTPADSKPVPPTDTAMTESFLDGDYCLFGGAGWWKHEYCHGRQVIQFHEDPKTQDRTDVVLGKWNQEVHLKWIGSRAHKRPLRVDGLIRQASHFYSFGDICDQTGRHREVEVRLRCRESKGNQNAVTLYLLEPKTCEYVLGVESGMLCNILQKADPDTGLLPEN